MQRGASTVAAPVTTGTETGGVTAEGARWTAVLVAGTVRPCVAARRRFAVRRRVALASAGMADADDAATNLAENIRRLRDLRGLSQQALADASGVPRPTWAHLESGAANPTLAVLLKAAAALGVTIEELVAPPRAQARLYKAVDLPTRVRGDVVVRQVLPDTVPGLALERLELAAGGSMRGHPHTPGTREYLACEQGEIELTASREKWRLAAGDVVVFRGDQPHSYRNVGRGVAVAYSAIALTAP